MSSIDRGMNIDEVHALGEQLKQAAGALAQIVSTLNGCVSATTWVGPDAGRFKNDWWPQHRQRLQAMRQDLDGFGQSALNNASEQERTSAVEGGSTGAAGAAAVAGSAAVVGGVATASTLGASAGTLPGSDRTWQQVQHDYEANMPGYYGAQNPKAAYQCTAWANFRWRELMYQRDGNYDHWTQVAGDGWQMAANAGGSTSTPPTLGAMASWGTETAHNHVTIVEAIDPGGQRILVSGMNTGADAAHGTPQEYRTSWLDRQPDGTWYYEYGRYNVGQITFAGLPAAQ